MTVSWSNLTCVAAGTSRFVVGSRMLNAVQVQSSLLSSHAASATIRPARFVRMRTIVVAIT